MLDATKVQTYKPGEEIEYTPGSAVTAGAAPIQIAGRVGIATNDIAANKKSSLLVTGIIAGQFAAVVGNAGDNVWWDANGTPVNGTASSGAFTTIASDGDFWVGTLAAALAATDGVGYIAFNVPNPDLPAWPERVHETKSADYTVDAQDSGKVLHIDTDAKTITLPATIAGLDVIFVNDGADGTVAVNLSPNAVDKIMGPDVAGTDDKDQINAKATAVRGDWMHLVGDGSNGWWIVGKRGTWAEEA